MEKKLEVVINVIYYSLLAAAAYVGIKYGIPLLMPFLLAFFVAWLVHPPARFLAGRLGIRERMPALLLTALFYIAAAFLAVLAARWLLEEAGRFLPRVPRLYTEYLLPLLNGMFRRVEDGLARTNPTVMRSLEDSFQRFTLSMETSLSEVSVQAVKSASGYAAGIPGLFVKVMLTVVSTFFFSADYGKITGWAMKHLPPKGRLFAGRIREYAGNVLRMYVRSYTILMGITFAELSVGFLILGVRHAIRRALLITLFDVLPVLGTGGILIPWAVGAAFTGDIRLFIGLMLLYVLIAAVRNVMEPRILGKQIGLNPLVTLIAMFLGMQLFGVVGLFGFPAAMAVAANMKAVGVLNGRTESKEARPGS